MIKRTPKNARSLVTLALGSVLTFCVSTTAVFADSAIWREENPDYRVTLKHKKQTSQYKVIKVDNRRERGDKHHVKRKHHVERKYYNRDHRKYKKKVTYYKVVESRHHPRNSHRKKHHGWYPKYERRHNHDQLSHWKHRHNRHHQPHRHKDTRRTSGFDLSGINGGHIIGAILGGAAGTQFGKGRGRTVSILGGAVLGAVIGGEVGKSMQASDHAQANRVLETAPTGQTITWNNPETGRQYEMTPTRTYRTSNNLPCRDYTSWVFVDGFEEQVKGRACRMPDGRWKMMS